MQQQHCWSIGVFVLVVSQKYFATTGQRNDAAGEQWWHIDSASDFY
jgi:hypothetical protein